MLRARIRLPAEAGHTVARAIAPRFAITLLLAFALTKFALFVFAPHASAADTTPELVQQLESAAQRSEVNAVLQAIDERLADGSLPPETVDHIVNALAARLAGSSAGISIWRSKTVEIFRRVEHPWPDAAFTHLIDIVEDPAFHSWYIAVEAFRDFPASDPRHARVVAALTPLVVEASSYRVRLSASPTLASLGRAAAFPESTIASLVEIAATDDHLTPRVAAAEALMHQPLAREQAIAATTPLVAELLQPTEVTRREGYSLDRDALAQRTSDLLFQTYEAPYPAHVIDLWIARMREYRYEEDLSRLRDAVARGELVPTQRQTLLDRAARARRITKRIDLYAAAYADTNRDEVDQAVRLFDSRADTMERVLAAHRIHAYYREDGIPPDIADIAAERIIRANDPALFQATALLLIDAADNSRHADRLLQVIVASARNPETVTPLIQLLPFEHLEFLLQETVAIGKRPARFRHVVISWFENYAESGRTLSAESRDALEAAAWSTNEYVVSQAAGKALQAWGAGMPLIVTLTDVENQGSIIGLGNLVLMLIDVLACIAGLVAISGMPLRASTERSTAGRRTIMIFGWLLASGTMLILAGIALLGMLSHGSPPSPSTMLGMGLLFYIGSGFFVFGAWKLVLRMRPPASSNAMGNSGDS